MAYSGIYCLGKLAPRPHVLAPVSLTQMRNILLQPLFAAQPIHFRMDS
jgi:hypothetical protein